MKRVIGLTGTMGSGKSTVSDYLRKKGIPVVDADEISRDLTRKGQPGYEEIVRAYGRKFLTEEGALDRRALGQYVFADTVRLARLEKLLHPLIIGRMKDELKRAQGTVVIDAPLLHKAGLDKLCGEVWVVSAPMDIRIARIITRDQITEREARARLGKQMPAADMEKGADVVLKNSGTFQELYRQIDEVLHG